MRFNQYGTRKKRVFLILPKTLRLDPKCYGPYAAAQTRWLQWAVIRQTWSEFGGLWGWGWEDIAWAKDEEK